MFGGHCSCGIFSWAQSYFCRDYSVIGGHTLDRGVCLAIDCTIFPFLVYKDVVHLYFTIVRVRVGP